MARSTIQRKPSTKQRLIDVGERLFGRHGFDGISLREIASEAGQANSNVVQYHFRDKPGLIRAILEDRVIRIEELRSVQLAVVDTSAPIDPRQMLKILWTPLMAIQDSDGSHTFCRFMLQYMLRPQLAEHPLARFYDLSSTPRPSTSKHLSCLAEATELLHSAYPDLPQGVFYQRLSTLATMFFASVVEQDNARLLSRPHSAAGFNIEPILDMALAALGAPA